MLGLIRALIPYIKPYWKLATASVLLALPLAAIKGYQVWLVKDIFDKGLALNGTFEEALYFSGLFVVLGLVNFPCRFLHFYWIRYVVDRATCDIRSHIYKKLQNLPMGYFSKSKQGAIISNIINDTSILAQGLRNLIDIIREPLTAVVMFGLALYRDWQLTLIIVATAPLFLIIFMKSGKRVRKHQGHVQEHLSHMTHNIGEGVSGQKITKAFNLQSYIIERFEHVQDLFFRFQMKTTKVEELAHPLVEFVGSLAFAAVILFAHHRISTGAMTMGDFVSFVTALALLMDPIRKFSQANVKLNQSRAASDRIFKFLEIDPEKDHGLVGISDFKDSIVLENLSFSYGEGHVIKNLNFMIRKGESVGLVGLSGSGKSTLINLLLGLYTPTEGKILVDGRSITDYKLTDLRNLYGLVSQEVFLFHDTIRENLRMGDEFSDEELWNALDIAGATEFVKLLPQGMDTVIGDRGTRLSGGQCQRITIARAFLRKRPILLFDEATSALDNESEKQVQAALNRLAQSKTVIAVAHRLSTIQSFDRIVVLRDGHKTEEGTHDQLMEHGGEYAKLYELSQNA